MQFFTKLLTEKDFSIQNPLQDFFHVYLEMLEQQRKTLQTINHKTEFDEDLIRKYLSLIDMEEFKIREKLSEEEHG
jgi:CPA1 family monovalent cation:H+ antiporter